MTGEGEALPRPPDSFGTAEREFPVGSPRCGRGQERSLGCAGPREGGQGAGPSDPWPPWLWARWSFLTTLPLACTPGPSEKCSGHWRAGLPCQLPHPLHRASEGDGSCQVSGSTQEKPPTWCQCRTPCWVVSPMGLFLGWTGGGAGRPSQDSCRAPSPPAPTASEGCSVEKLGAREPAL